MWRLFGLSAVFARSRGRAVPSSARCPPPPRARRAARVAQLGLAHKARGGLEAAEASYREALRLDPDFVNALQNLGNLLLQV